MFVTLALLFVGLGVLVVLLITIKRIDIALAIVVIGLALNIDLPVSIGGAPLNTQRVGIGILLVSVVVHFLSSNYVVKVSPYLVSYNYAIFGLIAILLFHSLVGDINMSTVVPYILNLILFNLIYFSLSITSYCRLRSLFFDVLPIGLILVAAYFLINYQQIAVQYEIQQVEALRTGFRARANEGRNLLNVWAATLALFIPIVLLSWLDLGSSRLHKALGTLAALALFVVVLTTYSRAAVGVLALTAAFGFFLYGFRRALFHMLGRHSWKSRLLILSVALLIIYVMTKGDFNLPLLSGISNLWELRLEQVTSGDESIASRLAVYHDVFDAWAAAPVFGHGSAQVAGVWRPTENTFLDIVITSGAVGIALYLFSLFNILKAVRIAWRNGQAQTRFFVPTLFCLLVLLFLTNDFAAFSPGTVIMAMILANRDGRVFGDLRKNSPVVNPFLGGRNGSAVGVVSR